MNQYRAHSRRSSFFIALLALLAALSFALIVAPRASAEIEYVTVAGKFMAGTGTYDNGDAAPGRQEDCTADPFIIWDQVPGELAGEPLTKYKVHFFDNGQPMTVDLYNRGGESPPFNDGAIIGGVENEQIYPATEPGTHRWQVTGGNQGSVESCQERASVFTAKYAGEITVDVPVEMAAEPDPPVDDPPGDDGDDGDDGAGDDGGDTSAACDEATAKLDKAKTKLKKAKQAKKSADGKKAKKKAAKKLKKAKSKKKKAKKAEKKNC